MFAKNIVREVLAMEREGRNRTENAVKKNGIVYTEDGVPVYTLYLGNIPRNKTEGQIKQYFSAFGEVTSVVIFSKNKGVKQHQQGRTFQYGFVTFTTAENASRALAIRKHLQISKLLTVKPADTWRQPQTAQLALKRTQTSEDVESETMPSAADNTASIMSLNDDCILHIFSFLKQNDLLKQAFVCQRFYDLTSHMFKVSKYFNFDEIDKNFTLMEIRQVLAWFGEHIRKVHLTRSNDTYRRYIEFVAIYCHSLEEINFKLFRNVQFETYNRVFTSSRQLKSLTMEDCDLNDKICSLMSVLSELETLNLSQSRDISGKYLKNLHSVQDLNLSYCENLEAGNFIDMCKTMRLKTLNIVGCYQLSDEAFADLVSIQTDLERIAISNSYQAYCFDIIGTLPSLKDIQIHREGAASFGGDLLEELSTNRKEALESLEVYNLLVTEDQENRDRILQLKNLRKLCIVRDRFLDDKYLDEISQNCLQLEQVNIAKASLVNDEGILSLVRNLKKLKFLNISHCHKFNVDLLHQLYAILENQQEESAEASVPLTLCVYDTSITADYLQTEEYKQYEKLLKLSFAVDFLCTEIYDDLDFPSDDSFSDIFDFFHEYIDSDDDDDVDFFSDDSNGFNAIGFEADAIFML